MVPLAAPDRDDHGEMAVEPKHDVAKVGVAAVILRDNQVLLGKRTGAHGAGEWAFPGGKVDWGEDPAETVLRELAEECGVEVDEASVEEIGWTNDVFPDDGLHFVTLYYRCRWTGGEPQRLEPHKCLEWRWFPLDELPEPKFQGIDNLLAKRGSFDR